MQTDVEAKQSVALASCSSFNCKILVTELPLSIVSIHWTQNIKIVDDCTSHIVQTTFQQSRVSTRIHLVCREKPLRVVEELRSLSTCRCSLCTLRRQQLMYSRWRVSIWNKKNLAARQSGNERANQSVFSYMSALTVFMLIVIDSSTDAVPGVLASSCSTKFQFDDEYLVSLDGANQKWVTCAFCRAFGTIAASHRALKRKVDGHSSVA